MHKYVWGPSQVSPLSGSHYYVNFINDATRKTWIYCIQNKSDVFDTFKKWNDLVENETGKRLKFLKSDNGGEYCRKEFDIVQRMEFIERRQFQEHHKKMVCQKE